LGLQSSIQVSWGIHSEGLEPGFGSSNIDVCIPELANDLVNVIHAEEYQRPDFNKMINTTVRLRDEYGIKFDNRCRIFVDGANPSFIRALRPEYQKIQNIKTRLTDGSQRMGQTL
jgi:hypothetical protein